MVSNGVQSSATTSSLWDQKLASAEAKKTFLRSILKGLSPTCEKSQNLTACMASSRVGQMASARSELLNLPAGNWLGYFQNDPCYAGSGWPPRSPNTFFFSPLHDIGKPDKGSGDDLFLRGVASTFCFFCKIHLVDIIPSFHMLICDSMFFHVIPKIS